MGRVGNEGGNVELTLPSWLSRNSSRSTSAATHDSAFLVSTGIDTRVGPSWMVRGRVGSPDEDEAENRFACQRDIAHITPPEQENNIYQLRQMDQRYGCVVGYSPRCCS